MTNSAEIIQDSPKMLKVTNKDSEWCPQYFGVITGLFCGLYMITAAINVKMALFFGLALPAGTMVFPICCILTDVLTEVYGFNRSRQAIWTVIACLGFFTCFTQIAILLEPASFWQGQEGFNDVFALSWRVALAASFAYLVGELSNSYIVSKMKTLQNAKNMSLRFIASTVVGQFFDTLVFFTIAFAGTMPLKESVIMILTAWAFKVGYETVALPVSVPITKWVKKLEGVEHFDKQELHVI